MDDLQKIIVKSIQNHSEYLSDRAKFKSMLQDIIPDKKLEQNLILDAYDESVIAKLSSGSDITMQALIVTKNLMDSYGLTKTSALWSVKTWCHILGHDEIGELLEITESEKSGTNLKPTPVTNKKGYMVSLGIYRADEDFPSGDLKFKYKGKKSKGKDIYYGIGNDPNELRFSDRFVDQMYVSMKSGQYIKLTSAYELDQEMIEVTKMS